MLRAIALVSTALAGIAALAAYDMAGKTCHEGIAISATGYVSVYEVCRTRLGMPIGPRFVRTASIADTYNLDWINE